MGPLIFFVSLFITSLSFSQDDTVIQDLIQSTHQAVNLNVENTEEFYKSFYPSEVPGASQDTFDANKVYYFDLILTAQPEYNMEANCVNLNFNQPFIDPRCSNTKRNGLLLYEKEIKEILSKKDKSEKIERCSYILIPDKCSSARFYNKNKEMICDNKIRFKADYDSAKPLLNNLCVRVGVTFISKNHKEYYEEEIEQPNSSKLNIKYYAIRANVKSIILYDKTSKNVLESYVSIK